MTLRYLLLPATSLTLPLQFTFPISCFIRRSNYGATFFAAWLQAVFSGFKAIVFSTQQYFLAFSTLLMQICIIWISINSRKMMRIMLSSRKQFKIFGPVVQLIMIDMMYDFMGAQWSPKMLFHYITMHINLFTVYFNVPVPNNCFIHEAYICQEYTNG